ncbi:MAG: phenylacetate--CoA ligase family protein [Acidobacteriaceae bacterium]
MKNNTKGLTTPIQSDLTGALVRHVIHPLWAKFTHPAYSRYMREFERNQYLHPDDLRKLQMLRLRQQLIGAYRYVPFYRHRMTQAGLTPLDIRTHEDLRLLPVLTKRDIQDHLDLLVSSNVSPSKRKQNQTGGSTGSPLQFYVDLERFDSRMASTVRHNAWAGLRIGDWHAQLWDSRYDFGDEPDPAPFWRQKFLYRNLSLHPADVTEESMMQYVEVLRKYRPRSMVSYALSAVRFAEFCNANNIHDIAFDSMIVSVEMLPPGKRQVLEETFHGKVFNRYGCREVSVIASECEFHSGLHVNADALIVEVEAAPNLPSGMGRVLVTDLLNRSMPLIRYEIGDLASLDTEMRCPCGRSLPLIGNIQGRTSNFLRLPSGGMIAGPSLALLAADMRDVRQVQCIQPDPAHVTLKVVAGNGYSQRTEEELRRRMQPYLEKESNLTIVTADSIPSEPPGKYRFVKTGEDTETPTAASR